MSAARAVALAGPFAALGAGAWLAAPSPGGLYVFAWSHPLVMVSGQFALLAAALLVPRPRAAQVALLGLFWIFSGMTAGPLLYRAADLFGGAVAVVAAVAAVAIAVALRRLL